MTQLWFPFSSQATRYQAFLILADTYHSRLTNVKDRN